jgi:(+)-pinoresinol hydroxylase
MRLLHGILLAGVLAGSAPVAAQSRAPSPSDGRRVYEHWCAPCHDAGPGHPGTQALAVKYKGSQPAELLKRTDITPELTRLFVRNGVSVMPFFRKSEISDRELDALARFLASAKK